MCNSSSLFYLCIYGTYLIICLTVIIGLVDCREELSRPNKSFQQEHINSGAVDPEEVDAVDNCSDRSQKTQDGVESMTQIVEKQNEENTCLRQNSHFTQQGNESKDANMVFLQIMMSLYFQLISSTGRSK